MKWATDLRRRRAAWAQLKLAAGLLLLSGFPATAAAPQASGAASLDELGFLTLRSYCTPTFVIDGRPQAEGAGFLLERLSGGRRTYLMTAQHLFSHASPDLGAHVSSARCGNPATGRSYPTGRALAIPGAHPMGPLQDLRDVAAFPVQGWSSGLSLAANDAKPGDPVWLLARVKSGRETKTLLHRAVVGRSSGFLAYRFDDQTIGLDQTSGGAVVNQAGEVVGLNIGYGRLPNGALIGVADSLATLQGVLAALP